MARHSLSPRLPAAFVLVLLAALALPAAGQTPPEKGAAAAPAMGLAVAAEDPGAKKAPAPQIDPAAALADGDEMFRQGEAAEGDAAAYFAKAVASYQAALGAFTREGQPAEWAKAQTRLAAALVSQAERTVGQEAWDQLEGAKAAARSALEVLKPEINSHTFGDAQHQLGRALRAQGTFIAGGEGEQLRADALAALRAALGAFDPKADAYQRAKVQADLGLALFTDSQARDDEAARQLLAQAAESFRASLAFFTKDKQPREWGDTQNMLGHTLREQYLRSGAGGDVALVNGAIAAYEAALSVRSRDEKPVAWLLIKNNLGTAKQLLASVKQGEEKAELLRQGYASIGEALEVATPEAYPQFWTPLRENQLGILLDQGDKEKAALAIVEVLGLPPEMGAEIKPSLLQVLDQLPPELQDDPAELVNRLRQALMRSLDPNMQDQHGAPAEDPAGQPAPQNP